MTAPADKEAEFDIDSQHLNERDKVRREIESRKTFSYKYKRFWLLHNFDRKMCCCCRPKRSKDDMLFKNAKKKLNEEIDILEIVKKLRVHQFTSQVTLQPHQRDLINFFREYKIIYDDKNDDSG